MGNSAVSMVFVLIINLLLFLISAATSDLNPDGNVNFYSGDGMLIEGKNIGSEAEPVLDTSEDALRGTIPEGENNIVTNVVNIITDTFNSIKSWFLKWTGFRYLYNMVTAPYSVLKLTGLPAEFVFGVGTFWYLISLFVVVSFFWGRE